jgi:hypothetical protein
MHKCQFYKQFRLKLSPIFQKFPEDIKMVRVSGKMTALELHFELIVVRVL